MEKFCLSVCYLFYSLQNTELILTKSLIYPLYSDMSEESHFCLYRLENLRFLVYINISEKKQILFMIKSVYDISSK
jgi:hypothetical protein